MFGIANISRQCQFLLDYVSGKKLTRHYALASISSLNAYDNTGEPYDVLRVLNADAMRDLNAYKVYSPLYLP